MISRFFSSGDAPLFRRCRGAASRALAGVMAFSLLLAPMAEAKRYGGGGKSYSSGKSRSSFGGGTSRPSTGGGGYSSGKSGYSSGGSSAGPSTSRSGYDAAAARAKQQADSQKRYSGTKPPPIPAAAPASGARNTAVPPPSPADGRYGSSNNNNRNYGGDSRPYRRSYSTGTKAALIGAAVLAPALLVYATRPTVHYQDSFGSPFWWWLLDQPQDVRANWLYHHQTGMDPARRAELLKADPALQAQVDALAAKNTPVDPAYAPPGLKADDMFTEPAAAAEEQTSSGNSGSGGGGGSSTLFWLTLLGGGAATGWLVFGKRWKPAAA